MGTEVQSPNEGQATGYVAASPAAVESEWRSILFAKLDQKRVEMREIEEALSALSDPVIVKLQRIINIVNRP